MIVQQVTRAGLEPATYGLKVDGGERKDNDLARAHSEEASSEVPQCPTSSDPPATNSATANFAPCGERRGFCICKREEGHEGLHACRDCSQEYETVPGLEYCDRCGKLCYGEKDTAEEPIKQDDGTVVCGECAEEDES